METTASDGADRADKAGSPVEDKPKTGGFVPLVCVVDFHHARGPEVERWFGSPDGTDPAVDNDWSLLPFMALSDGAHASTEDFSYFTLLKPFTESSPATSLFGISCTRQMDAAQLLHRPPEVTRSTVQKAVVVIADTPQFFGMLRERLSVVTSAWFAQCEFTDVEILRRFQDSLADEKERGVLNEDDDRDQYLGMSLRELVREFRWQTLVLLKCCLLQPKMLFFGSRCERLCMMQFSLISLIPGLLRNLQDCAAPELNEFAKKLTRPTSLRTSDRNSLLSYMGLPLQIFAQGSLFGPYTPLQQLDILADFGTKSYIVGSTNSLLLQQRDRYSDILINLDENSVNVSSPSLRTALQLSVADRRWIDFITQEVNDTWDDANPGRPKTMGYVGSEEFIRLQFEEYLLSLISSVKYHTFLEKHANDPKMTLPHIEGDPSVDFAPEFVEYWTHTENYRLWSANTDSHLFDIVEPKHPCAGGLTIDDVQRRIAQQVQDLHLDERFAMGREVLGRNIAAGREKASSVFNKLYADMESLREAQRRRAEEQQASLQSNAERNGPTQPGVDHHKPQQPAQSVGSRAGAYVSSWAAWAGEKRKAAGWGRPASGAASSSAASTPTASSFASSGSGGGGGGGGWGFGRNKRSTMSSADTASERDFALASPRMSVSSRATTESDRTSRPLMQEMFGSRSGSVAIVDAPPPPPREGTRPLSGKGMGVVPTAASLVAASHKRAMSGEHAAPPAATKETQSAATELPEARDAEVKEAVATQEEDTEVSGKETSPPIQETDLEAEKSSDKQDKSEDKTKAKEDEGASEVDARNTDASKVTT